MSIDRYAFISWIASISVYIVFVVWAFAPSKALHSIGVTYYPNRYWAVALPSYVIVASILVGVAYIGVNMMNTFDPEDLRTVTDDHSRHSAETNGFADFDSSKDGIPDLCDMDPVAVTNLLITNRSQTSGGAAAGVTSISSNISGKN